VDGTERAGGASLIPSARRGGGPTSPPPPLVTLSAPASGTSAAFPSAAPRSPGTRGVSRPTSSPALAGGPGARLSSTGSSYARSCPHRSRRRAVQPPITAWWWKGCCGSFALARPGVNCPSALGRGRRYPAGTNAGVKRACGHVSCRSCCRLRLRSCLRLEPFKWDCSIRSLKPGDYVAYDQDHNHLERVTISAGKITEVDWS